MKSIISILIPILILFNTFIECGAQPQVDIGATLGPEGLRSFYFSIQEYFKVPEKEIIFVRERKISDEELPVVFFIAQRARVLPKAVIDLRLAGRSWIDITLHFGLNPEIFYVPVKVEIKDPPYGKAYGHYKKKPRKEWREIRLLDGDIINLVNLKFISEYHKFPPEEVIKMRSEGKNFVVVNEEIQKGKGRKGKIKEQQKEREKSKGKRK